MTSRVFVVQDDPSKNFIPAMNFGDVSVILPAGSQVSFNSVPTVNKIVVALRHFTEQDYIIAVGDPVAIGIACAIAAVRTGGKFRVLKWDRQEKRYFPVHVDIPTI